MTQPEGARRFSEILPNCHLMLTYDAADAVDADPRGAVASIVEDFLVRHDKFLVRNEIAPIHP